MFLRFDAELNGRKFSEISPHVLLRDIVEIPAAIDIRTTQRAGRYGQTAPVKKRLSLSIRLVYRIREYDIVKRAELRNKVAEWAQDGGWLTINTRPGLRLRVVCDTPPAMDSSLRWTQDLSFDLIAYTMPYWETVEEQSITLNTAWSDSHQMYYGSNVIAPDGNVDKVPVTCFITNGSTDGTPLTNLRIVVDETAMEFEGMNIKSGGYLGGWFSISYNDDDVQEIRNMRDNVDTSLLKFRTAESNDDLLARSGTNNQIQVYSNVPITATFYARGRWV